MSGPVPIGAQMDLFTLAAFTIAYAIAVLVPGPGVAAVVARALGGGFRGAFTADMPMTALRVALRETAQKIVGPQVRDTLIIDLVRQDS